ncbi:MAG: two-component system, OmpR family, response regulator RegX3 [Gaiellales bacterium]|nr:two-component system, OmpR family, response regulator RegX3 [Gaiellales bacterium]
MLSALPHPNRDSALVLVVEDEPSLAESIRYSLERECCRAVIAADGERALDLAREQHPSLVLLDLMLPKLSGLDVCRLIRQQSTVPIMILTAKSGEADKVAGLELGADDYMTKPFSMRELVSRVRAHLRRAAMTMPAGHPSTEVLRGGPVELDLARHEARVRGTQVRLTPKEFSLLALFLERQGRLLTRDLLISELWGDDYFGDTKTLDVHVKRLRQKIELDPPRPAHLVTVRGLGYRFLDDGAAAA